MHVAQGSLRNLRARKFASECADFRKLCFVNRHGGQPQVLDVAALDARMRHGDLSEHGGRTPRHNRIHVDDARPHEEQRVLGDATLATKDMGVKLLNSLGQGWAQLIREIHLFKQPAAGAGPLGS